LASSWACYEQHEAQMWSRAKFKTHEGAEATGTGAELYLGVYEMDAEGLSAASAQKHDNSLSKIDEAIQNEER